MQREGKQVQRGEQVRQAVLAVPEVVLEVVAVARQGVERRGKGLCEPVR